MGPLELTGGEVAVISRARLAILVPTALVLGLLLPLGYPHAGAAGPSWGTLGGIDAQVRTPVAVSCPSASSCVAVATTSPPSILTTDDAGVTWTTRYQSTARLLDVSCPSATRCYAVGEGTQRVLASTDGGATWAAQASSASSSFMPQAISCATELACSVVGGTVPENPEGNLDRYPAALATGDGGSTWQLHELDATAGLRGLTQVDCPTAQDCVAVGDVAVRGISTGLQYATTHDGWATINGPRKAKAGELIAVACPSASHCVMASNGVRQVNQFESVAAPHLYLSDDGGATWHAGSRFPADHGTIALSCPSATECVALVQPPSPGWAQGRYSKPTLATSTDGGDHFATTGNDVSGDQPVGALRCRGLATCTMVVGSSTGSPAPAFTQDTGAHWTTRPLPEGPISEVTASACIGDQRCLLFGRRGVAPTSQSGPNRVLAVPLDGGEVVVATMPGSRPVTGVACPSSTTCLAVSGKQLLRSTDQGATWKARRLPRGLEGQQLACSSTSSCTVFATYASASFPLPAGFVTTSNAGVTWSPPAMPRDFLTEVSSMSCPSARACVAVGLTRFGGDREVVVRSVDAGRTWGASRLPRSKLGFGQVACPSPSLCLLLRNWSMGDPKDGTAQALLRSTDEGRSFKVLASAPPTLVDGRIPEMVACSGPLSCVVDGAFATTDGGVTWSGMEGTPPLLQRLSCPSASTCFGVTLRDEGGWSLRTWR